MVPLPIHETEREHSSLNVLESSDAGKPAHLTAEMVNGKRTLRPPAPLAARLPQRQRPANQAGTRVFQLWQKTVVVLIQARAIKPDRSPGRKNPMKAGIVSLSVIMCLGVMGLGFASSITPALADADDAAWIKKCVGDNKREGATPEVVAAWCSCMNNKMSSEETLSITAWEKSHPAEVAACDKESGWK